MTWFTFFQTVTMVGIGSATFKENVIGLRPPDMKKACLVIFRVGFLLDLFRLQLSKRTI